MAVPLFIQPLVRYADFQGRARRAEYWQWTLLMVCGTAAFYGATAYIGLSTPLQVASGVWSLITIIPGLAVTVRRYHDSNRTGWWLAYLFIAPALCVHLGIAFYFLHSRFKIHEVPVNTSPVPVAGPPPTPPLPFDTTTIVVWSIFLLVCLVPVVFLLLDGTPRNNRFGPDPKGRGAKPSHF